MRHTNVVVIITDQQRADLTRREGYPLDVTPFVDTLAQRGAWFSGAYTTAPVCAPARTSVLTGRFPSAHGVTQNAARDSALRTADIFSVARAAGYATALVGKNHTYLEARDVDEYIEFSHNGQITGPRSAEEEAFDEWLTHLRHRTSTSPSPGGVEVQNPHRLVSHALGWLDALESDAPFLLYLAFPEPHNPYQAPAGYFDVFPPEDIPDPRVGAEFLDDAPFEYRHLRRIGESGEPDYSEKIPRARANYLGMLRLIDDQIARFTAGLAERGVLDDTLLLVTSDHGDYFGEYGLMRKGAGISDFLMRVPLVVSGPDVAERGRIDAQLVSLADILPTVCDYLGVGVPVGVQGRSLRGVWTASEQPDRFDDVYGEQGIGGARFTPRGLDGRPLPGLPVGGEPEGAPTFDELNAVTQAGRMRMLRSGPWKLIVEHADAARPVIRLHHLPTDPAEIRDVSAAPEHRDVLADLMRRLVLRQIEVEDVLPVPSDGYERAGTAPGGGQRT
ncbi:sulfatase-like hydrolase/transferase [Microbacterium sp. ABRD28]|uniref:sulfatase family protein n=1 Tax=Microbacterium sp. ABRD28 TaxID=2268461 RepID=UPI000F553D08|nr:sulfatase-like hydrolase/transferase [Microbacterium sp. ABRD28]AZC14963.1 sulfatase [Microbacterium sp. ABRD28]